MDIYYKIRAKIIRFFYVYFLKHILFLFDPEDVHDFFVGIGKFLGKFKLTKLKTKILFSYQNKKLENEILGIKFKNPIGLAAGFDKDAVMTHIIGSIGFGFTEVGSVTAKSSLGNPKPRLWRLPKDRSLGVWYGLKNKGAKKISEKLYGIKRDVPIGVSVAFTNCKENLDINNAISDYISGFRNIEQVADYITINISCPNTEGGLPFIIPENYEKLMSQISKIDCKKPIFVKISPDMSMENTDSLLEISGRYGVSGIICSNLRKRFDQKDFNNKIPPHGGLSGKAVFPLAMDLLSYMYRKEPNRFVYIFCGGVFDGDDAYKAIKNGASLVELITGMIFEGPQLIGDINRDLAEKLNREGFKNISEAIGFDNK